MAVRADGDTSTRRQVSVQRKQAVAEIGFSTWTEKGDGTRVRQRNNFLVIHVRCVNEAPVVPHIEILEQPAHRTPTV